MKLENILENTYILAHRGYSHKYPENTMLAFEKSIGKADLIEFDVQFSKDGFAVILHDTTLNRTSDIEEFEEFSNSSYKVEDYNYKELLKLNFNFMEKEKKQKIVSLKEFLLFAKEKNIFFNLEIKNLKKSKFSVCTALSILEEVKKHECQNLTIISSFNHEYLKEIREVDKSITLAALVDEHKQIDLEFLKKYSIDGCNMSEDVISEEYIKLFHDNNMFVGSFTVNDKKRKEELKALGVNFIYTDKLED